MPHRGRPLKYDENEMYTALTNSTSQEEAAARMKCGMATIKRYAKRLGVVRKQGTLLADAAEQAAQQYVGERSTRDVAEVIGTTLNTARYLLRVWITHTWRNKHHPAYPYAVPLRLEDIKIVQGLLMDPTMFDDPDALALILKRPKFYVREYMARSFDRMQYLGRRDQKTAPPPAEPVRFVGRRAKPVEDPP